MGPTAQFKLVKVNVFMLSNSLWKNPSQDQFALLCMVIALIILN